VFGAVGEAHHRTRGVLLLEQKRDMIPVGAFHFTQKRGVIRITALHARCAPVISGFPSICRPWNAAAAGSAAGHIGDAGGGRSSQYNLIYSRGYAVLYAILPKKPTRVAAPSSTASLGRRSVCGRTEQRRPPVSKRYETKIRMV